MENNYEFSVTNLYIAQVKRKHGILEHENYNQTGNPDGKQPHVHLIRKRQLRKHLSISCDIRTSRMEFMRYNVIKYLHENVAY